MNYRSDNPHTDWPETMVSTYRSEAFPEDLEAPCKPATGWSWLERFLAALPLICVFAPVADAYLIH